MTHIMWPKDRQNRAWHVGIAQQTPAPCGHCCPGRGLGWTLTASWGLWGE